MNFYFISPFTIDYEPLRNKNAALIVPSRLKQTVTGVNFVKTKFLAHKTFIQKKKPQ